MLKYQCAILWQAVLQGLKHRKVCARLVSQGSKKGYGELVYAAPKEEGEGEEGAAKTRGGQQEATRGSVREKRQENAQY